MIFEEMRMEEMSIRGELIRRMLISSRVTIFSDYLEKTFEKLKTCSASDEFTLKKDFDFIEWIGQKAHTESVLNAFLKYIKGEIDEFEIDAHKLYFLKIIESDIKSILERRKNEQYKKEKEQENIVFMQNCYFEAIREIAREGREGKEGDENDLSYHEAKRLVYDAINYIGTEISETDKKGTEELMSKIKDMPYFSGSSTLNIAFEILSDWLEWLNDAYRRGFGINGPEMTKSSIKKAILKRSYAAEGKIRLYGTYDFHNIVCASVINPISVEIMEKISERYDRLSYCSLICDRYKFLRDSVVMPVLRDIVFKKSQEQENQAETKDTFKPGDRVFFIKQRVYSVDPSPPYMNLFLGIVKDWRVGYEGKIHYIFDNAFYVMNLGGLDLDICDSEDVKNLVEREDFSNALFESNLKSVYGDVTLYSVDESLFPKLNKILAKVVNPNGD
jgi:hypothetical protein